MESNPHMQSGRLPFCHYKAFSAIALTCPKARDTSGRESYDRGLPPFRRKPHDQAVSKSVEQKPEIIPGQILDRSSINLWPTNLWSSGP
jgi:hypothetical protein